MWGFRCRCLSLVHSGSLDTNLLRPAGGGSTCWSLDPDVLLRLRLGRLRLHKLATATDLRRHLRRHLLRRRSLGRGPGHHHHAPPWQPVTPHPVNGHRPHSGQLSWEGDTIGAHDIGDAIELQTSGADLAWLILLLVTGVIVTMMVTILLILLITVGVGSAEIAATSEIKPVKSLI